MDSKESDTRVPHIKETGKAGGNFQYKELEALKQRLEEDLKTMKKIARVKTMLKQNKKMDKSKQRMEHLQKTVETGRATLNMHTKRGVKFSKSLKRE